MFLECAEENSSALSGSCIGAGGLREIGCSGCMKTTCLDVLSDQVKMSSQESNLQSVFHWAGKFVGTKHVKVQLDGRQGKIQSVFSLCYMMPGLKVWPV